jgi:hypothetical protein
MNVYSNKEIAVLICLTGKVNEDQLMVNSTYDVNKMKPYAENLGYYYSPNLNGWHKTGDIFCTN